MSRSTSSGRRRRPYTVRGRDVRRSGRRRRVKRVGAGAEALFYFVCVVFFLSFLPVSASFPPFDGRGLAGSRPRSSLPPAFGWTRRSRASSSWQVASKKKGEVLSPPRYTSFHIYFCLEIIFIDKPMRERELHNKNSFCCDSFWVEQQTRHKSFKAYQF